MGGGEVRRMGMGELERGDDVCVAGRQQTGILIDVDGVVIV